MSSPTTHRRAAPPALLMQLPPSRVGIIVLLLMLSNFEALLVARGSEAEVAVKGDVMSGDDKFGETEDYKTEHPGPPRIMANHLWRDGIIQSNYPAKPVVKIVESDVIGNADTFAFHTSSTGGTLEKSKVAGSSGTHLLTMHGVSNTTAVVSDSYDIEAGAKKAPFDVMHSKLPTFAILFVNIRHPANKTTQASTTPPSEYLAVAIELHELLTIDTDDHHTNVQPHQDPRDIPPNITLRYRCTIVSTLLDQYEANVTMPLRFSEAALLVDLLDYRDRRIPKARREMSLGYKTSTGELGYNMQQYLNKHRENSKLGGDDEWDFYVQAQGVLTIGWMFPASAWAWICCPAWLTTCPSCTFQVILCCV